MGSSFALSLIRCVVLDSLFMSLKFGVQLIKWSWMILEAFSAWAFKSSVASWCTPWFLDYILLEGGIIIHIHILNINWASIFQKLWGFRNRERNKGRFSFKQALHFPSLSLLNSWVYSGVWGKHLDYKVTKHPCLHWAQTLGINPVDRSISFHLCFLHLF